ncbi:type IX secretion system sortase PorU [Flavobacterium jejuense]|uniref:Type IX secretion system sortase PorU n=1 Tax=Flavobacterium jejuense TaxID=1544455 RepID=A0ABX0ITK1_9FLAO|nr:type IX secretion system sortase PorU [Flavobacterium jejuense]NHN27217.1 type IX secretion system sortase PorU [Flavobacterium jejuense]
MKKKLLYAFLLIGTVISAQNNKSINLKWNDGVVYSNNGFERKYPSFDGLFFSLDVVEGVISYKREELLPDLIDENSLQVTNVSYQVLSEVELLNLNKDKIPNSLLPKIESFFARDQVVSLFSFSPIVKNGNVYKKVVSLNYNYNFKSSSNRFFGINSITNSVFASGNWYRFYVEKSGVYKISKSFLQSLGFDVNVDPRNIKIYGNGGRMLPLLNSTDYPEDIEENAIQFIGESDGVFNDSDYILFYAEGVDTWNEESLTKNNLFSDKSYYYVTSNGGQGKRIFSASEPSASASLNFSKFDDTIIYEKDLVNIAKVGRRWFGEAFNVNNNQNFNFSIPNVDLSVPIAIKVNMASVSFGNTSFQVKANNQSLGNVSFLALQNGGTAEGFENVLNTTFPAAPTVSIDLIYNNGGVPSSNGYLDFIMLKAKRNLQGYGKQFLFYNEDEQNNIGVGQYTISNANSINQVWDVTDISNVTSYSNPNQSVFSFKVSLGFQKKYIAIDNGDFYIPLKETMTNVSNQNLKGTIFNNNQGDFQDIDYLIISPEFLINQAERLANFHRNNSGLVVKVVNLESIYKEFSSGKQDVAAIRNFVRYVYRNASDPSKRVKYVNLFGDASYDYKDRLTNNTNVVPVFHGFNPNAGEVNNSSNMSLFTAFISDDFFGLMDDNEGPMTNSIDGIDIAVGRMLVSSVQQAQEMVDKVIDYHDEQSYGRWRNSYIIYSDDADTQGDAQLQFALNNLADDLTSQKPFVNVKKIHTDAYIQQVAAGGERYPDAKNDFLDALRLGALVVNYLGHGSEESLARERLFEKLDAQNLYNPYRYPLFITITCDFTRFDDPNRFSGGEYMYWNAQGGAVSLIATTRLIGVTTGLVMNDLLNARLYAFGSNEYPTIAEALRLVKLQPGTSDNRRVVFYIGDPALKLAIPKPKVVLTEVNDVPIDQFTGTFQALSLMKIKGAIVDENDAVISNYNGDLAVQIFDKDINRTTLGNNGVVSPSPSGTTIEGVFFPAGQLITMGFNTSGETIFRGNASVNNGVFELSFVVPQDIKIPVGNGKISFYSKRNNPVLENQAGYNKDILIGGVNTNAPADNTPPVVRLYLNDESFVSGSISNCSPILLAFLEDENGINTASGIGHDIVAILDGDESNPYVLNDYYETENDDYTRGKIRYQFRDLSPGLHTIVFKAWDVYNNLVTTEIQFNAVCGSENITLERVLNYPNPFVSYTEFWFTHNRPFEPLDVQVQILTITGKLVRTINQQVVTDGFLCRDIKWDGKDDFGDKIGKGVYVYKLTVRSASNGDSAEKYEKLVIL